MQVQIARRTDAIKAAQQALMERTKSQPGVVLDGILERPEMLYGIKDIEPMLDIFVEHGMFDKLEVLAQSQKLPKYIVPMVVTRLM